MTKQLYIIGGANGAGKTTSAYSLAPSFLSLNEFVNADEIAKGLSPFNPDNVSVQAGKIMLDRIDYLVSQGKSFAIETTCSGQNHVTLIRKCQNLGYMVTLLFLWLANEKLAISRVSCRVKQGGHDIPTATIRRRYNRGIKNLIALYIPLCNNVTIYNASNTYLFESHKDVYPVIAKKESNNNLQILDSQLWQRIKAIANE